MENGEVCQNGGVRVDAFIARCRHKHTPSHVTEKYHIETKRRSVVCGTAHSSLQVFGETAMKSLKLVVGLASIATLFLTVTPIVAYGATITLRPLDATQHMLAANVQAPSCATPHTDAALAGTPFFEMPQIAENEGNRGASVVEIDLLPNGALNHYALEQSSGNSVLDHSAFRTARMTKYQPETQNCVAIPGSYLLEVDF